MIGRNKVKTVNVCGGTVTVNVTVNQVTVNNVPQRVLNFISENFGTGLDWVGENKMYRLTGIRSINGLVRCLNTKSLMII